MLYHYYNLCIHAFMSSGAPPPNSSEGRQRGRLLTTAYHFNTAIDAQQAKQLLVYLAQYRCEASLVLDHVGDLGGYRPRISTRYFSPSCPDDSDDDDDSSDHNENRGEEDNKAEFMLGDGEHEILHEERVLLVQVKPLVADSKLMCKERLGEIVHGKEVTIYGVPSQEMMQELLRRAAEHAKSLVLAQIKTEKLLRDKRKKGRRFLFDAKQQTLLKINAGSARKRESLFLKEGEQERLFGAVATFLDSKARYRRFNVPHKLNILLYGVPGGGKSTTIAALASHFGLDLAIVPFSPYLNDDSLAVAMYNARMAGCRLIALEDVDRIFSEGRHSGGKHSSSSSSSSNMLTLSGLLNCMDGLLRGDGLIMVFTANSLEHLEDAVLRTARVDFALRFTHADEFQARSVFEFYYPKLLLHQPEQKNQKEEEEDKKEKEWKRLRDALAPPLQFTVADLQQFFFRVSATTATAEKEELPVERFKEEFVNKSVIASKKQMLDAETKQSSASIYL